MDIIMSVYEVVSTNELAQKALWSLVIGLIIMVVTKIIKNTVYKKIKDSKKYYTIKQRINYVAAIIFVVYMVFIWFDSVGNITTYIGLLSAGIAIALKEIFINIAGWIFIESRKPFDVGHRIMIGNQKGDVIDKRMFQFTLIEVSSYEEGEQSTGRIIDIPNGFIFIHPIINYTKGFEYIWNEIKFVFTFESDWKEAKAQLLAIANKDTGDLVKRVSKQIKSASKKYMIHYNNLTPIVYTDIKDSGIQLTVRYLCEPQKRRTTSNDIWEDALDMIDNHENINLAYPTKRVIQ